MTVRAIAVSALLMLLATMAQAADRAIIVLDASGSMWGQIDGQAKIAIARQTLSDVLKSIPPTLELGLMAYGHREKASCSDIELIVPPAPGTAPAIIAAANGLTPLGKTPLTEAVRQAAEQLQYTEDKATVILITDGIETCNADPCAVAAALEKAGVDLTVHVVGFGLSESEGKQVACLAANTGGKYFNANNATGLGKALSETVGEVEQPAPAPPTPPPPAGATKDLKAIAHLAPGVGVGDGVAIRYDVYKATADGHEPDPVDRGAGDDTTPAEFDLPAGRYVVVASKDLATAETTVDVTTDKEATADVILNAAVLTIHAMVSDTTTAPESVAFQFQDTKGGDQTNYGSSTSVFMNAGDGSVKVSLGAVTTELAVTIVAGQNQEHAVIVAAGRLVAHALLAAGGPPVTAGPHFDVLTPEPGADGQGTVLATSYDDGASFDLAPGKYVLRGGVGIVDAEMNVEVKGGTASEYSVVLNAGILTVTAPGGDTIELLAATNDASGNPPVLATNYGESWQSAIGAGDYIVRVTKTDGSVARQPVTITAGGQANVTVQ